MKTKEEIAELIQKAIDAMHNYEPLTDEDCDNAQPALNHLYKAARLLNNYTK